jgi:hypothetical protein
MLPIHVCGKNWNARVHERRNSWRSRTWTSSTVSGLEIAGEAGIDLTGDEP